MKTLKDWLEEEVGRSKNLAKALAVSVSSMSQMKNGDRRIPPDWMPVIEKFTNGEVTVMSMVLAQAKGKLQERKRRLAAKA